MTPLQMLAVAVAEARKGLAEGGIPIGAALIGESRTFTGGHDWLAEHGVAITLLDDESCASLMADFIAANPALWNEDIGVPE